MASAAPILGIETSNPSAQAGCGVALVDAAGRTLAVEPLRGADGRADDLAPSIDRCLRAAGVRPADVRTVAVSAGPGGFTSVRIAVTTAKMLAEATGASCVPVPTALVVAHAAPAATGPFCVALASKGSDAHVTVFGPGPVTAGAGRVLDAAGLTALHRQRPFALLLADRFLPQPMRDAAERLGVRVEPPVFDPVACALAAAACPAQDPARVVPIYPREPEAVTKWRAMHGKA
ncbi:MAG TPA: tRNA (adenosine(37)-N6)-threonylcarbamoyltransferase complex dimerization subunit type 1 TsaB [Phycisphaerales bacterium]|nr:tRNA (adenosine(37)-N6)-threonylcarbamoyltransferase complex dimerization subunit type 1 TsaB [Phycisphaerales bacterium]